MNYTVEQLNEFLGKASVETYAGDGIETKTQRPGFTELEYNAGDFAYRDSYTGFLTSAGQEVIWYKGEPIWTQQYSGGMEPKYQNDEAFAHETFSFLKKALSQGKKKATFQPRGSREFKDGNWEYYCDWTGDITNFEGKEKIVHKNEPVFYHIFSGGILKHRAQD